MNAPSLGGSPNPWPRLGAELAFTYQGEAFGKRLEPLAASVGSDFMVDVDVTDDASLDAAFEALGSRWPTIDFVVHAIAFSDKSELTGRFLNTSRANFKHSMDISAYSFIEVARRAHPLMTRKRRDVVDADLPRFKPRCTKLQRNGRGQGGSGISDTLPCQRSWTRRHSR